MLSVLNLTTEVEPYLIFANRYYLRKLNLDGSNYTLIKQVSASQLVIPLFCKFVVHVLTLGLF